MNRLPFYALTILYLLSCEESGQEEPLQNGTLPNVQFSFIGDSEENNLRLVLTCPTDGAKIFFTSDNTTPTLNSQLYTEPIPINSDCDTIKAIAAKENLMSDSVTSFRYWEEWPYPPVPLFSIPAGVFNRDTLLSIKVGNVASANLNGPGYYPPPPCVKIYYTLDGSLPTINSPLYSEPFHIQGDGTLFQVQAITAGRPFETSSIVVKNVIRIDYSSDPSNYDKNLSLDEYNSALVGKWVGNIRFERDASFVPYNVELNFDSSGKVVGYALSQNFSYFGGFSATYYGLDGDVNTWVLNNVLSNGKAEGEFWAFNGTTPGLIKNLSLSDNRNYLEFSFWHFGKYPWRYKLIRIDD